ncbi:MAG: orotidine-5'-phosphate decarboxylase [Candidatus Omnitrophica bacterium]|nr:orotidine-5'-phosphate decarboxylase [Candidatus Omnitrophota bacterium]
MHKKRPIKDKLIVALDVDDYKKAKQLVKLLYPVVKIFKVGSQLFTACGPEIVKMIQKKGAKVFLDLKFHDIPNTVKRAVEAAARLKVNMLTVHLAGGREMLEAAVSISKRPKIVGVTVLTSKSKVNLRDRVLDLAKLAKDVGLDGVVCSAHEATAVRQKFGRNFLIVTPGIRPKGSSFGDQKRVVTPKQAIKNGADFIVVGRPIIKARNPKKAALEILKEIK